MFKNKVNIIESKFPPTNKNDWWFDLNENILKRYFAGEWKKYDTTPPKPITMPADNEIWVRYTGSVSEDDIGSYISENIFDFTGSWKVKEDVIIITDNNVKNILSGDNLFMSSIGDQGTVDSIKVPKLSKLGNDMETPIFSYNIDWIIIQDIDRISNFVCHDGPGIICLANIPPQVSYLSFGEEPYDTDVYVKDELLDTYQQDTNWCDYNIRPISKLDQSIYNWG